MVFQGSGRVTSRSRARPLCRFNARGKAACVTAHMLGEGERASGAPGHLMPVAKPALALFASV